MSEFQCEEDDEDEEENFVWYELRDKDTYFTLTCCDKNRYQKDDQVFHCYGRMSNQCLL